MLGEIEELNNTPCIVCPWHYYHISLKDGEKWYQGTQPDSTGKLQPGPWKRCAQPAASVPPLLVLAYRQRLLPVPGQAGASDPHPISITCGGSPGGCQLVLSCLVLRAELPELVFLSCACLPACLPGAAVQCGAAAAGSFHRGER